jgi:hypothetical protein
MQTLSIFQNDSIFVATIDKQDISNDKLNLIENLLRSIMAVSDANIRVIDDSHIPYVDDEEQAEIEAILDARTEEDRQVGSVEIVTVKL